MFYFRCSFTAFQKARSRLKKPPFIKPQNMKKTVDILFGFQTVCYLDGNIIQKINCCWFHLGVESNKGQNTRLITMRPSTSSDTERTSGSDLHHYKRNYLKSDAVICALNLLILNDLGIFYNNDERRVTMARPTKQKRGQRSLEQVKHRKTKVHGNKDVASTSSVKTVTAPAV